MNVETLYDLFVFELQGLSHLETELADALSTLRTQSRIDSLDEDPGAEFRERASDLIENHEARTEERAARLEDAFDALDRTVQSRTRKTTAVDALVEESERFDNVVLDDALRNPFYVDVVIKAEELVVQCYESVLDIADHLGLNPKAVEILEANRDDVEELLEEARELDESPAAESLFDRLAAETPTE